MSFTDQLPSTSLGGRLLTDLAGDVAAGAISATLISPPIAIINRVTAEKAAINQPLLQGLRKNTLAAIAEPMKFLLGRPFGLIWALYAATYTVSNCSETLSNRFHKSVAKAISFLSTSMVNVPLGIWKDVNYARIFGAPPSLAQTNLPRAPLKTPVSVTGTFLLRDGFTILGAFTLAPALTSVIPDSVTSNLHAKATISQMVMPVISQFAASSLHLLGLNFYNQRHGVTLRERGTDILRDLPSVTLLRCVRIIPAFSTGCVVNTELRAWFHNLV